MAPNRKTLLLVDADESARERLANILKRDARVLRAGSAEGALGMLGRDGVDLVLSDAALPGVSGFDFLRIVRENYPLAEFVMLADAPDVDLAVQAVKLGAYHVLVKSAEPETVRSIVAHASERQDLNRQVLTLSAQVADQGEREFVGGSSPVTRDMVDLVHRVATLSATVLILGESGTGKELVARLIHRESSHPDGPFIAVNVAAIPRELVESTLFGHERGAFTGAIGSNSASSSWRPGGTLFLDEIGDLRSSCRPSCCARFRRGRSSGWAAASRSRSSSG